MIIRQWWWYTLNDNNVLIIIFNINILFIIIGVYRETKFIVGRIGYKQRRRGNSSRNLNVSIDVITCRFHRDKNRRTRISAAIAGTVTKHTRAVK